MKKVLAALVALTFVLGAVAVTYYPMDAVAQAKKDDSKKKKDEKKKK
ncbi:MAG: hypothetical protein IT564_09905 [Rhodospirillales bacterium]|nr:hypothetical protein [Rhodospirillales bacterium]